MARTNTNGSTNDTAMADLTAQIDTLRNDLQALSGTIADLGQAKGEDAAKAARAQADAAQKKGAEAIEQAGAQARELQSHANGFMREQPAVALGLAAGAGFLVGLLGARR
ncbi:MAG: DUF883 domain-containing protein [Rhodobacteraceae bacterium]|nr:DUF883 domain-containing protein [Paracoccaceae bacterium]